MRQPVNRRTNGYASTLGMINAVRPTYFPSAIRELARNGVVGDVLLVLSGLSATRKLARNGVRGSFAGPLVKFT